jgi:hypothetical protein
VERSYLVFWCAMRAGFERRVDVVKLAVPPCDTPKGDELHALCTRALPLTVHDYVTGVVELGTPGWHSNAVRDIALGNGRVATLECHSVEGWRVHV